MITCTMTSEPPHIQVVGVYSIALIVGLVYNLARRGGWGGHQIEKMESKYAVMNIITVVVAVTWCSLFHTINVAYKYLVMHLRSTR